MDLDNPAWPKGEAKTTEFPAGLEEFLASRQNRGDQPVIPTPTQPIEASEAAKVIRPLLEDGQIAPRDGINEADVLIQQVRKSLLDDPDDPTYGIEWLEGKVKSRMREIDNPYRLLVSYNDATGDVTAQVATMKTHKEKDGFDIHQQLIFPLIRE